MTDVSTPEEIDKQVTRVAGKEERHPLDFYLLRHTLIASPVPVGAVATGAVESCIVWRGAEGLVGVGATVSFTRWFATGMPESPWPLTAGTMFVGLLAWFRVDLYGAGTTHDERHSGSRALKGHATLCQSTPTGPTR